MGVSPNTHVCQYRGAIGVSNRQNNGLVCCAESDTSRLFGPYLWHVPPPLFSSIITQKLRWNTLGPRKSWRIWQGSMVSLRKQRSTQNRYVKNVVPPVKLWSITGHNIADVRWIRARLDLNSLAA